MQYFHIYVYEICIFSCSYIHTNMHFTIFNYAFSFVLAHYYLEDSHTVSNIS